MLFDTDVLIWVQRGNREAAKLIDDCAEPCISIYTYMELLQAAQNKNQHKTVRSFLKEMNFSTLPLSGAIGQRAAVYVEEFALSHGLRAGDAVIAATAIEHNLPLCSANRKHFDYLQELNLRVFKP
ncbi:MAG: type II toxin-antitoxin system VapC family toxin [Campylobacterales bacterium]